MKKFIVTLFICLCLVPTSTFAETVFFSFMKDVPVMQGMYEHPDETILFDKPSGRIVEHTASTPATQQEITAFYDEILPQLGWHKKQKHHYIRGSEQLHLYFTSHNTHQVIRFVLSPIN